jgi:hypothetical protein
MRAEIGSPIRQVATGTRSFIAPGCGSRPHEGDVQKFAIVIGTARYRPSARPLVIVRYSPEWLGEIGHRLGR